MSKKKETTNNPKLNAFLGALEEVNSKIKHEKISLLKDDRGFDVPVISTGSLVLDTILGCGGFPVGRIIEMYGAESSGKTSIALNAIANVQRQGGTAVFIDAEQAFDPSYARKLGVNVDELGFTQAVILEDVLFMLDNLCRSGAVDMIVVDSLASLIPKSTFDEEDFTKQTMGLTARIMSTHLRKIAKSANQNKCTIIFLNQIRDNIGSYIATTQSPGGRSLKFFASQRIEVRKRQPIEEDGKVIGTEVFLKVSKNKVSAPYGEGLTVISYNKGVNRPAELFKLGEELGIIQKEGRTYYCVIDEKVDLKGNCERTKENKERVKIGVNSKPVIKELEGNKLLFETLSKQLVEKLKERNSSIVESSSEDFDEDSFDEEM